MKNPYFEVCRGDKMKIDRDEAKKHFANKSAWHPFKGKVIEVGLYIAAGSVKLNKPAPQGLSIWTLDAREVSLDSILQKHQAEGKATVLNIGRFTCPVWRERQDKIQALAK
jgi:hypothetical protein